MNVIGMHVEPIHSIHYILLDKKLCHNVNSNGTKFLLTSKWYIMEVGKTRITEVVKR
jgi:hypothetical protein